MAVVLLEVLLRLADGVLAMEGRGGTYTDEGLGGGGVGARMWCLVLMALRLFSMASSKLSILRGRALSDLGVR